MTKKGLLWYLVCEGLLLSFIQAGKCLGWNDLVVQVLMYAAILINTILAAHGFLRRGTDRKRTPEAYVAYALFVTAAADFFLTLIGTDRSYLPGIILFCLVQAIYALYLRHTLKLLLIRVALFAVCLLLFRQAGVLDLANAVGLLDISLLLVNAILSWTPKGIRPPLLFRIGIVLFLCCDLSIALRSFTAGGLHDRIDFFVWIFYIPSQVGITLSYLYGDGQKAQWEASQSLAGPAKEGTDGIQNG